jgi:hypothetical protein
VCFAKESKGVARSSRPGVPEQIGEDVGDKVREQIGFLEIIRAAGGDEFGPVLELGHQGLDSLRQLKGTHVLPDDFRVEERLGFDGHCFWKRLRSGGGELKECGEDSRIHLRVVRDVLPTPHDEFGGFFPGPHGGVLQEDAPGGKATSNWQGELGARRILRQLNRKERKERRESRNRFFHLRSLRSLPFILFGDWELALKEL